MANLFKRYKQTPLAYKLSAAFFGIISILGIVIYSVINTVVTDALHEEHELRGGTIASNLASNSSNFLLVDNRSQLQLLLRNSQKSIEEIVYIYILSEKGQVVVHTFPGGFPGALLQLRKAATNTESNNSLLLDTEKGILLDIAVPILHGSLGYVHLGYSCEGIYQKLEGIQYRLLLICLLAFVGACFLAVFISKRITRPLKELVCGAEKIGRGDYSHRVSSESGGEFGTVTDTFNMMAESLEEDIRKLIEAEKTIKEREEVYRSLVENVDLGITLIDKDHTIVMANSAQGKMFKKGPDEFIGRKCFREFEKRDDICDHCPGSTALETGLPQETIAQGKRDDGSTFTVKIRAFPVHRNDEKPDAFIEVVEEITEQLKTEQELLKVKKLESVGVLAGGIAHDFNNILAAILGNINLALLDTSLKEKTRGRLAGAERAAIRAKGLTQQLLTFAKGGEPVREASSLENVIVDSADFVLTGDKVSVRYNIPGDLWLVDIDKGQMSQVVQNIVQNASHAMPEGGTVTITCRNVVPGEEPDAPVAQTGRYVKIIIQDEGIGIPEDAAEKIFDPYFSTKHDGSGLGLSITHSIISKHFGNISVQSEPGAGAAFILYLPASEQKEVEQEKSGVSSREVSSGKILVMDDDVMLREVAREMLLQMGCEVGLAKNGAEAVEVYRESVNNDCKYDCVILDLTVPGGMGGKEAVQEILAINSDARVIVSSGYSTDPVMAHFSDFGFCAAIVKPYNFEEMAQVLSQVLD